MLKLPAHAALRDLWMQDEGAKGSRLGRLARQRRWWRRERRGDDSCLHVCVQALLAHGNEGGA